MGLLRRLEVAHEPDLTFTQLLLSVSKPSVLFLPPTYSLLQNEDLEPVPAEKRTWKGHNFLALCALFTSIPPNVHCRCYSAGSQIASMSTRASVFRRILSTSDTEQVDDRFINDPTGCRAFLVASVDLRMDRLRDRSSLYRPQCQTRRNLPCHIPCSCKVRQCLFT